MESDSARSTILIVDDDLAILEYAGGVLEEYGYAVLTASNAASALVMLRRRLIPLSQVALYVVWWRRAPSYATAAAEALGGTGAIAN